MNYISTRNNQKNFTFKDVFLKGLADDGGLFVPQLIRPFKIDELDNFKNLSYNDLEENYWFSLNREDILEFTGKNFSKYIIYLDGNYQLPRPKKITANISNNHQKYAITWFSLALSILLLYLYFRKKNY